MIEILFQLAESSHFFIIGMIIMIISTMIVAIAFNFTSGVYSFASLLLLGAVGVAVGSFMIIFPLTHHLLLSSPISQLIVSLVTSAALSLTAVFVAAAFS